jgi:uncharacterized DUF497 family protein
VRIEWDDAKDLLNREKHGLSFAEARSLFESEVDFLEIFDSEHSKIASLRSVPSNADWW